MSQSSEQRAALMLMHAMKRVEQGHTSTKGKLKHLFVHAASEKVRNLSKTEIAVYSVTAASFVAGTIVAAVFTAGIAVPVMAGIAAGTYALSRAIKAIGSEVGRANRNWLNRYQGAVSANTKNWVNAIGVEAKDAIRRAVDHYNKTNEIANTQLKKYTTADFHTCNDAINRVLATSRFLHHTDKVRNYLLCCLDFCIIILTNYKSMSDKWNVGYKNLEKALVEFFDYHEKRLIGHCNSDPNEICYGPATPGSPMLRKPHPSAAASGAAYLPSSGTAIVDGMSVDLSDLIRALMDASLNSIEKPMRRGGPRVTPFQSNGIKSAGAYLSNYHSAMPVSTLAPGWGGEAKGVEERFTRMVNDCFARVDDPNYLIKVKRNVGHFFTRHTNTELLLAGFGEVADLSSIATPFIPNLDIGKVFGFMVKGSSLIKGAISAGTKAVTLFGPVAYMKAKEKPAIDTGLLNWNAVRDITDSGVRAAGVKVEQLIVKTGTHFNNAFEACKAIEELNGCQITTCRQAWEYSKALAEVIHEFGKMERYLMMTLSLIVFMAEDTIKWAGKEQELWAGMEEDVSAWLAAGPHAHHTCIEAGCNCYGPKRVGVVRSGTVSSFLHGRYDYHLEYNAPHKPI